MKKSTLYIKASVNIIIYVLAILLCIFLLPKVLLYFLPFVIGWIVSAIAHPIANFFERKIKFKKKASSAVVIVLLIAIILATGYGIIAFLINQGIGLVEAIPDYWNSWQKTFDTLGENFNETFSNLPDDMRDSLNDFGASIENSVKNFVTFLGSSDAGSNLVAGISSGIGSVANALIGIIMCVLSAYFFTVDHAELKEGLKKWLPVSVYDKVEAAGRGLKNAIGGYFKAQLQIECWVYLITVIGLALCRVDFAIIIALGIAFLDFLPFFGAGLIMVPWGVIYIINGEYLLAAGMLITWGIGQLVRQLIQPKYVGANVGMAPLPTLVFLFIGYKAIGVFGMVIAVPIAMIIISLYEEGLFASLICSIRILWDGIYAFRRLPEAGKSDTMDEK